MIRTRLTGQFDYIHLFADTRALLVRRFEPAMHHLHRTGMLWVSWPKKASGVKTDVDENAVRSHGLACGLVDVKICAVDDVWSGLKFVWRVSDR